MLTYNSLQLRHAVCHVQLYYPDINRAFYGVRTARLTGESVRPTVRGTGTIKHAGCGGVHVGGGSYKTLTPSGNKITQNTFSQYLLHSISLRTSSVQSFFNLD